MELLTNEQMRRADRKTMAQGISGPTLMELAGQRMAEAVEGLNLGPCHVLILCGPGNNGGDGFVAARLLQERGYHITLFLLGDREKLKGDARLMARRWAGDVFPFKSGKRFQTALRKANIVIDSLFGSGLSKEITGDSAKLIEQINQADVPIIAVDMPSGIDGDTGQVKGAAIKADQTVTFFRPKPGHFLYPGKAHVGRLWVRDIGISPRVLSEIKPKVFTNDPALWRAKLPILKADGHKYHRGSVLVVGSAPQFAGAANLSALAALKSGAGLVTLAHQGVNVFAAKAGAMALMQTTYEDIKQLINMAHDKRYSVFVIGPGKLPDEQTQDEVLALLKTGKPMVIDAGAISAFEGKGQLLFKAIKANKAPVVITPHDGEFARLFGAEKKVMNAQGKLAKALTAAKLSNAVILYKGADSVIACPSGKAVINDLDAPYLATAGSGDVLAGVIGGLLASGVPAFEAACAAVYKHSEAGAKLGRGLIADDLLTAI